MNRLLIIDDDIELCALLAERLGEDGFVLHAAHEGQRGLELARSGEYSLVILDVMLPRMGGMELLKELRSRSSVPVLMLTARGDEIDRIVGLEVGADDYLPKPFNPRELVARIKAILRRLDERRAGPDRFTSGDITIDIAVREAWIDGNMCPDLACSARAFVDGDAKHKPISAASILAKTARDAEMCALHDRFPHYGFAQHKGYATAEHLEAVGRLGPCEVHRRSFHAVGVFFQPNLFATTWEGMAESLRIRSYRLYCEAVKLSNAARQLAHFEFQARRLRKTYADVFAAREAASHVDMVRTLLRDTRAQLRAK